MKKCPKCGELLGDSALTCFKCKSSQPKSTSYRKICQKCQSIYSSSASTCEKCHSTLAVHYDHQSIPVSQEESEMWPYVVGFLFPVVGVILGLIYIGQKKSNGGSVLGLSLFASIFWVILSTFLIPKLF